MASSRLHPLEEKNIEQDPFDQFDNWFKDVLNARFKEPTAVVLATSTLEGHPSARMVLMKEFSSEGFVFYTNYRSRKGRELAENPNAALLFYWDILERQVRIEGRVEKVSGKISDAYFVTRPRASRIGAIISPQSRVIESREGLEKRFAEMAKRYASSEHIPRPSHWGGYILKPHF
ncbi:MAG TPA: pyridoxamine 5'-phosphate oxidase, partial [Chitinophagales bacterium]|nr:pyridoxamine 5'-phosphate oxidase [Chitinophagales bacterium]